MSDFACSTSGHWWFIIQIHGQEFHLPPLRGMATVVMLALTWNIILAPVVKITGRVWILSIFVIQVPSEPLNILENQTVDFRQCGCSFSLGLACWVAKWACTDDLNCSWGWGRVIFRKTGISKMEQECVHVAYSGDCLTTQCGRC